MNLVLRGLFRGVPVMLMLVLALCCCAASYGQAFATIGGRVLDPKGATVPDATVTATNTETGIVRTTKTTSDGLYRFDNLPPGLYDVVVAGAGFSKGEAKGVKLQVGEQRDINFSLALAGTSLTVTVTSELPMVEMTKTDVSTVIDDKSMADLPTTTSFAGIGGVSNDYEGLATAAPGVKYDYTGNSADIVGPGATNSRGIVVNMDGGNISDQMVSSRDALGATVEEVKEFQVLTNNYNAEYGQAGNVILNVITKSGTNQVHGDFHAYFRGRNLGASDTFYNQGFAGATIDENPGCPASDFDAAGNLTSVQGCGRAPFHKNEYGFTVGGPFIKDRLFWFASLEKTNQGAPATTTPFGQSITVSQPTAELLGSAKLDAKLTDKHLLTIRYNLQRDLQSNLLVQTGPNTDPSGFVSAVTHVNGLNIGMVSTLTPHTVNEARFYWQRLLSLTPTVSTVPGEVLPTAYVGADFCCPQGALQHRFQYVDNFSWTRGKHTVKAGVNISHFPYDSIFQQYHFGAFQSFSAGGCKNTLFSNAGAQNLCPNQFTFGSGPGFVHSADNIYGLYLQDTFQITRNLTLNYGLRYDVEIGAFTGGTIKDSSVPGGCLQSNGLIPACGSDHNNWQPRLGIAWSPSYDSGIMHHIFGGPGKSVIRASGAVVTEMAYLNVVLDSLNFDGKNLNTATIAAPASDCFLANGSPNPTPAAANAAACKVLTAYPNAPTPANLLPFTTAAGGFGRIRPISPTIKNPTVYMGSAVITRQIGPSFVFSLGYQGVFGHGLFGETDLNFPVPVADPAHPGYFYIPAAGRPDPLFGAKRTNFSDRTSTYHGFYLQLEKRMAHHFQFQGSYTFSKTLGTGEDFFGLSEPANPFVSLKNERGPSQQDIRHLANFSMVADTKNMFHTPIVNQILNNWTFGLIGTLQSGRPYPISTGDGSFAGSAFPALGSETNQRPNVCDGTDAIPGCAGLPAGSLVSTNIGSISGSNYSITQAGINACNSLAVVGCPTAATTFAAPTGLASGAGPVDTIACKDGVGNIGACGQPGFTHAIPVDFQFLSGNLGRNLGLTSALYRFDVSITKAFKIPKLESGSLELKLDAFNVFNHPLYISNDANDVLNFFTLPQLTPGSNITCTASCLNPLNGQYLGANGAVLNVKDFRGATINQAANFAGLGAPAAVVTPRILQLGIRLRW